MGESRPYSTSRTPLLQAPRKPSVTHAVVAFLALSLSLPAPSRAAIASRGRRWRRVVRSVSNCLLVEFRPRLFKTSPGLMGNQALTRGRPVGGCNCGAHADPEMDRATVRQVGVDGLGGRQRREAEAGGRDGSRTGGGPPSACRSPQPGLPGLPGLPAWLTRSPGALLLFLRWGSSRTKISNAAGDPVEG